MQLELTIERICVNESIAIPIFELNTHRKHTYNLLVDMQQFLFLLYTIKLPSGLLFYEFRCGTHSMAQGYTIEQDLSKGYPECCAKLVKMERNLKRGENDSSSVKIKEFKPRERSIGKATESKKEKVTSAKPIETSTAMDDIQEDTSKRVSE